MTWQPKPRAHRIGGGAAARAGHRALRPAQLGLARGAAEERFHRGSTACIVCTSTLELGTSTACSRRTRRAASPRSCSGWDAPEGARGRRPRRSPSATRLAASAPRAARGASRRPGSAFRGWRPWLLSYPRWLRLQARRLGLPGPKTGAVCFTRRFGSQLNLNLHHYALVPDGGFPAPEDGAVSFEKLPRPRGAERCRSTCRSDRPRPARADCPGGRRAPSPPGPPALPSGGDRRGAPAPARRRLVAIGKARGAPALDPAEHPVSAVVREACHCAPVAFGRPLPLRGGLSHLHPVTRWAPRGECP